LRLRRGSYKAFLLLLCFILAALSFAGIQQGTAQAADNSVTALEVINGGFEEIIVDGVIPGWTQTFGAGDSGGSVTVDNSQKQEGNNSLKINDNATVVFGVESAKMLVEAGSEYSVTAAVYIAGAASQMQLKFYDAQNIAISGGTVLVERNAPLNVWQTLSVNGVAPVGAASVAIVLVSAKTGKGITFWDDVQLSRVEPGGGGSEPDAPVLSMVNGGFEQPASGGESVPGWTIKSGQPAVTTDNKRMGENSLLASLVPGTGVPAINVESGLMDVEENTTYTLSAEVFLQTGTMEGLYVYVYDKDDKLVKSEAGKDFHVYLSATTDHEQWKYHEASFKVQPGGVKLKVSLITGAKKTLYFYVDEVSIMKKVTNGDFELPVTAGVIPGWSKEKEADASSFEVTSDRSSGGDNSMHLVNTTGEYVNVISELIPVEAGATYTATARTWLESGSADMYLRFFDVDRKYMKKQAWSIVNGPTDVWFDQYVTAEVPEGAQYAAILYAGSPTKTFSYYVDDVKLLRGEHEIVEEPLPENAITIVGEDMGAQIRKATIMRGAIGLDGDGKHVIYTVVAGAPSIFTIIDLATEKVVKSLPMPETSGAWSVTMSNDGSVYLGAYNLGLLYRYVPSTDTLINLGHPLSTKDSVLYPMAAGPDGIMYGSTYPTAVLYAYNPATNQFNNYGTMSTLASGERWTRVVAYDEQTHKIYAGVGNVPRLLEYDLTTGAKRDLLPAGFENIISVYDLNVAGGKLFARKEANNANETFVIDIASGEMLEVTNADTGESSTTFINFSRGVSPVSPIANSIYYAGTGGALYEYDLNTDTYKSLGASIEGAAIAYEFVELAEEGFPGYSLVGLSGNSGKLFKYNLATGKVKLTDVQVPAEPVNIHEIAKGPDGKIYTAGYLQGNLGVYTPSSGESMYYDGIGQGEGITSIDNKLYLGVYPGASIYEYDLAKPWNRTNSDLLNPNKLFALSDLNQDRPFGMGGAEDLNKLFVGSVPKNGMLGGVLAVYDLEAGGAPELYENVVPNQSILSFAYKDGLLYGGTSIHGGQGGTPTESAAVLFIWDVVNKKKLFEVVPVAGKQAITALHVGPDGNIWGLANGALFIFDTETHQVIHSDNAFPNAAGRWIDGSMETGSDGNVYATVGGYFFKVDAATKEITVLASKVRKLAQDDFGSFYMFTEPESPNLYKYTIPELLLKLTGVELTAETAVLEAGQQMSLSLKGLLEKGRTTQELSGAEKVYTSSAAAVAEVDQDGKVTAKSAGTAQLKVQITLNGVTVESAPINVVVTRQDTGGPGGGPGGEGPNAGPGNPQGPSTPQGPDVPTAPGPQQPQEPKQPEGAQEPQQPETPSVSLSDVAKHWAQSLITQAVKLGFVSGYVDGSFQPDREVTRIEFAAMLSRALQLEGEAGDMAFADATAIPAWAKPYVARLVQEAVISGFGDNTFRPTKQMTRMEAIIMIVRSLKLPTNPDAALAFADAQDVPQWARADVAAAAAAGLVAGRGDNRLAPQEPITRAETVALVLRMLSLLEK
jgi:WD40 repeat protein